MGFPENVLAKNERIEKSMHPHWLTVAGPAFLGIILVVGAVGFAWITPDSGAMNLLQWVIVALAVACLVALVLLPLLRWRTTHYVVTSHRVMVRRGIINKSGKDITLAKITDVSFEQNVLDRILGAGTLHIESAGDSPDEDLKYVPHSNQVQQLLNRLIDEDDNRRRLVGQTRDAHLVDRGEAPRYAADAPSSQDVSDAHTRALDEGDPGVQDTRY